MTRRLYDIQLGGAGVKCEGTLARKSRIESFTHKMETSVRRMRARQKGKWPGRERDVRESGKEDGGLGEG